MKIVKYILPLVFLTFFASCEKSELESPAGEPSAKLLPAEQGGVLTHESLRGNGDHAVVRNSNAEINDDGDDETGNGKPTKKE